MSDEESVKELHKRAINAWGYLDAAMNNAGISNDAALFADLKTENFREMLDINVLGVFWAMQHQLRHMEARGYGRIINLASIAGRRGILCQGSYVATKHAVSVLGLRGSKAVTVGYNDTNRCLLGRGHDKNGGYRVCDKGNHRQRHCPRRY
jgi:NADP-dependent 3-hydroxy acid dehydrogenase YdfG